MVPQATPPDPDISPTGNAPDTGIQQPIQAAGGQQRAGCDGQVLTPATTYRQAYAAIDLGTNNCRLLIARPSGDHFVVVEAFSRVVRLGEG